MWGSLFNELKRRDVFRVATAYAVSSWLIIQIVVSVFPYLGIDDFWITTIIVLLLIGFPIAVIGGWIYEMTPDGIRKTDEIDVTEEFEEYSDRKLNRIIIGVLATVITFMLVERVFFAEGSIIERDTLQVQTASVAVLPFVDMSENQDQEYFSDGLSEELLNVLAKVEGLQVAGRTSSFQYKGQNIDLRLVGEDLGVNHVLEGSVRKFGNQIRITAQLIKADDGFHVWSDTYTREYSADNLFSIQDEISSRVLQELQIRLLPDQESYIQKSLTSNTLAYDLYLRANQLLVNRRPDEIEKAIALFDRAIEEDSEFAAAYARRAIAYNLLSNYGNLDRVEMMKLMRKNIDRALLLDSDLGWAYAALGEYHRNANNMDDAHIALEKAFELMPGNPDVMIWYAQTVEEYSLYNQLIDRAYESDPLSALAIYFKARLLYDKDEFDEAIALMEKNLEINPRNTLSMNLKAEFIRDQPFGQLDESFKLVYETYQLEPRVLSHKFNVAELSFDLGFMFLVDQMVDEIEEDYPENFSYLEIKYDQFLYESEYDSMLAMIKQIESFFEIDPSYDIMLEAYMYFYLNSGRLTEAETFIDTYYPEIPALDFEDYDFYLEDLSLVSNLYDKLGDQKIANELADRVCALAEDQLQFDGDLKKESVQNLMDLMDCVALRKDKDRFLNIVEEIHFNRKSKANIYTFLDGQPVFDFLDDDPEYRALRERIEADIEGMRTNAVEWMKANNYWQDEWQITVMEY